MTAFLKSRVHQHVAYHIRLSEQERFAIVIIRRRGVDVSALEPVDVDPVYGRIVVDKLNGIQGIAQTTGIDFQMSDAACTWETVDTSIEPMTGVEYQMSRLTPCEEALERSLVATTQLQSQVTTLKNQSGPKTAALLDMIKTSLESMTGVECRISKDALFQLRKLLLS